MNIEQHRPRHVVLYALAKWEESRGRQVENEVEHSVSTDAARAPQLREHIGPCQSYKEDRVRRHLRELEDDDLTQKVRINGKLIGFSTTTVGRLTLSDMPTPKHFDH